LSISDDPKVQLEQMSGLPKACLENIFRALNQEKYLPSHHYVVTIACLGAFRKLQRQGVLPVDWCVKVYKDYTDPLLFRDVRVAAFGHLVDHLQVMTGSALRWKEDFGLCFKIQDWCTANVHVPPFPSFYFIGHCKNVS
jgi:hypothetical protein